MTFGDDPAAAFAGKPATQMLFDQAELGRLAVEMLVDRIERPGKKAPPSKAIPYTLQPGQTTAKLA
jgi:DNA-binding LacI/PurR family transcriptional regulator